MKILNNYLTYYSKKTPNKDYVIVDDNKYSYKDTEIYVNKLITRLKKLNNATIIVKLLDLYCGFYNS